MNIESKLKSLAWYARRPQFIPHLWYQLQLKFKPNEDIHRQAATAWCQEVAKPVDQVMSEIGFPSEIKEFNALYPIDYQNALQIQKECPIEMGGQGFIDLIHHIAIQFEDPVVLETGVAYGWSSLSFLKTLKNNSQSHLFSIDLPYLQRNNDDFVGCVVPKELRPKWTLIRSSDRQALPSLLRRINQLSIAHYDSDKTYHGRMWAYPRLWDKLEPQGVFISDDINDNFAFRDFCKQIDRTPLVVKKDGKHIGILRK